MQEIILPVELITVMILPVELITVMINSPRELYQLLIKLID